jgi:integrase
MAKFSSAKNQAANVIKAVQGNEIKSVGTARNYEQALTRVTEYIKSERLGGLRDLTPEQALTYLEERSYVVGQSTLNMERQAIQTMMKHVTGLLDKNENLEIVNSKKDETLNGRAYTSEQITQIANSQNETNSLSTQIAYYSGLRAHELLTLQRREERLPSDRPALESKFTGRSGEKYTVNGKGGLIREVVIPRNLALKLEERRLEVPRNVVDRGVNYKSYYDIAGGKKWSNSFSAASNRVLSWSTGAHGVRHSYAQERLLELRNHDFSFRQSLEIISQELGHFRSDITEVYLR